MKFNYFLLLTCLTLVFNTVVAQNKVISQIQYDGVYVEIAANQYIALKEAPSIFYVKYASPGLNYSSYPNLAVTDAENRTDVKSIKKVIFNGFSADDMSALSFHPAGMVSIREVVRQSDSRDASNYYTYKAENEQYLKATKYNINVKKIKENYYEVTFPEGISISETYLLWIKKRFWFFKSSTAVKKAAPLVNTTSASVTGAYLKSKTKTFNLLQPTTYKVGRYSEYKETCRCYVNQKGEQLGMFSPNNDVFFLSEIVNALPKNIISMSKANFAALTIKGGYDFSKVEIYKPTAIEMGGAAKKSIVSTESVKYDESLVYLLDLKSNLVGQFQKQTVGDTCTFIPSTALEAGTYCIFIGKEAWVFIIN